MNDPMAHRKARSGETGRALARQLRAMRAAGHYTQNQIADLLGLSQGHISWLERYGAGPETMKRHLAALIRGRP